MHTLHCAVLWMCCTGASMTAEHEMCQMNDQLCVLADSGCCVQEHCDLIRQAHHVMLDERMHETASSLGLEQLVIEWGHYIDRVIDAETALVLQVTS